MKISKVLWTDSMINSIYHYTSPIGFCSILTNQTFRFTDCQFFNDKSEYIYIKEPCEAVYNKLKNNLFNEELLLPVNYWLNNSYETYGGDSPYIKYRYYIFCLSQDQDSLSMWNYYVKNTSCFGYNIGIDVNKFINVLKDINLDNVEIIYGSILYKFNEQVNYIEKMIKKMDSELNIIRQDISYSSYIYSYLQEYQTKIIEEIEFLRLFMKHNAFKDEAEYRFVLKIPINIEINDILVSNYQIRNGIITPCYDLKLDFDFLNSITISPMLESNLAAEGIRLLMKNIGCNQISIKTSKIPIRF